MFRRYFYDFPVHLIPPGSKIVIYGASDMGVDYGRYIFETAYCRVLFFVDRNHANINPIYGCDIVSSERIKNTVFDYILIASTNYHEEIRKYLLSEGIVDEKLIYAEVMRLNDSPSPTANLYLDYFVRDAKDQSNRKDRHPIHRILLDSLDRYRNADLLESVEATERLITDFHACDSLAFAYSYEDEKYYYGYLNALMRYCGYWNNNMQETPDILHGVFGFKYEKRISAPFVLSSDAHQRYDRPMFETGPYICYTDSLLSESDKRNLKGRYGKILIAFPAHNSYFHKGHWNMEAFRDFLREKGKQFDSVFICIFFQNIYKDIIDRYRSINAEIVTCGVRTDQDFVRRCRSLLEISDTVAINSGWGSPLSFALALDKPVIWFDSNIETTWHRDVDTFDRIPAFDANLALLKKTAISGEYLSEQARQYGKVLYCHDRIRPSEELRAIFEMNELIYKRSYGDGMLFREHTERYMNELAGSLAPQDALKFRLLSDAWNKNLDRQKDVK
jgi:hypothetical protein